jgi:hypothetical protein
MCNQLLEKLNIGKQDFFDAIHIRRSLLKKSSPSKYQISGFYYSLGWWHYYNCYKKNIFSVDN